MPGTHHLRFLVDDQWRIADDLPTAVDDQGSLANYVAVGADIVPPSPDKGKGRARADEPRPRMVQPGHSFWSSHEDDDMEKYKPYKGPGGSPVKHRQHSIPRGSPVSQASPPIPTTYPTDYVHPLLDANARWTSQIPPELEAAAVQEEEYLQQLSNLQIQHQQQLAQLQASGHRQPHQQVGFVPIQIPNSVNVPVPGLPRHLEKLILNVGGKALPGGVASSGGSGTVVGAKGVRGSEPFRERKREGKRDRERERDREGRSERRRDILPMSPLNPGSPEQRGSTEGTPAENLHITLPPPTITPTSSTTPETSLPTTPTPGTTTPTNTTTTSSPSTSPALSPSTPTGTSNIRPPSPQVSSTRPRPIPLLDDVVVADDNSMLPVPSHVVLHHLTTSAIKNGVLATGTTVRYYRKYLTVVYYKPT
jgi:hypothetical protein